jgi:multicomponent Na+:H+ antiporter subunit C
VSVALIATVAGLAAIGTYLVTSRSLTRMILGFSLLGHGAVLALLVAGGPPGRAPLADQADGSEIANPLPQALALTAIVISFGLSLFLLALARRQAALTGDDLVEDDVEDRRVARMQDEATGAGDPLRGSDSASADGPGAEPPGGDGRP